MNSNQTYAFVHTCDKSAFESILKDEHITVQPCRFMNRPTVYSYWGIPNYRIRDENDLAYEDLRPVCFILDNTKTEQLLKETHKTDSGFILNKSFRKKLTNEQIENHIESKGLDDIAKFKIIPDKAEDLAKHIERHFGGNEEYWLSKLKTQSLPDDIHEFYLQIHTHIRNILDGQRTDKKIVKIADSRVFTIEAMFLENIPLSSVKHMIVPQSFKPSFATIRNKFDSSTEFFLDPTLEKWDHFHTVIRDRASKYFSERGVF